MIYLVNLVFDILTGVPADTMRNSVCSHVARILREKREERGMSMRELAHQGGLSQAMISYVEHELRNPTLDTLLRMSHVLKVDLAHVLRQAQKAAASVKKAK